MLLTCLSGDILYIPLMELHGEYIPLLQVNSGCTAALTPKQKKGGGGG